MAFKTLQLRRDTAANWASVNPILASGEIGYETDTDQFKFGNGTSTWNQLTEYYKPGGGGGGGGDPGGSDTQVQFNDNGVFGGDSGFTFDKTTKAITLTSSGVSTQIGHNLWAASGRSFDFQYSATSSIRFAASNTFSDGASFQGYGGLEPTFPGNMYFDYGSSIRNITTRSVHFRSGTSGTGRTVMHLNAAGDLGLTSGALFGFTFSAIDAGGPKDTALGRNAAGVVEVNDGTLGTFRDLKLRNLKLTGGINETVYTDGDLTDIDPALGGIQTVTLAANRTPTATNFADGQSVTLMIASNTFTVNWATVNPKWIGGAAPTLPASGYAVIVLWKIGTQVYGNGIGDVA